MDKEGQSILLDASDPRWMNFICERPEANVFHHPNWMTLMRECYGYSGAVLAVLDASGRIQAGVPFMDVESPLTGRKRVSLPFSDYCNPLAQDPASLEMLTDVLVAEFQSGAVQKRELRWCLPARREIQQISEFVLHTIKLDPDPDQISKRFKRTHLQNIHQAKERGVAVRFGQQLQDFRAFYNLQLETRRRHGVPAQPWKYFQLLWQHIVTAGMGFALLAEKDGEIIAGMVYLAWGKTLIAKYAASREDRFNLRPNNLLFWEGIRWGCEHGFASFDMGRTEVENTGLRNFKSRWGAVEEPLYYSVISSKPYRPSSGKLRHLMEVAIRNSPLWVCRLSGELLYRYVG